MITGFTPGDSGSWVVNETTGEVYGHVVSVDALGEAYVMPIQPTLQDIRTHLGAHQVRFPSKEEIASLRALREQAAVVDFTNIAASWNAENVGEHNADNTWGDEKEAQFDSKIQDTQHQPGQLGKRKVKDYDFEDGPKKNKIEIQHQTLLKPGHVITPPPSCSSATTTCKQTTLLHLTWFCQTHTHHQGLLHPGSVE